MVALRDKVVALGIDASRIVVPALDDEIVLSAAGSLTLVSTQEPRVKPEKPKSPDWDNDLAELVNAVRDGFHSAADDKARAVFVRQLRRSLDLDKAE